MEYKLDNKIVWLPDFTKDDLEHLKNQSFIVKVFSKSYILLCKYSIWDNKPFYYGIVPDNYKDLKYFDRYELAGNYIGLQQVGKEPFDLGNSQVNGDIKLLLPIQNVTGDGCGVGYCKTLDCLIGYTPEGKWMEKSNYFILPDNFNTITIQDIEKTGVFIGNDSNICLTFIDYDKCYTCSCYGDKKFIYNNNKLFC